MSEIPDRIDGETIQAEHINVNKDRTIQRYTDAAVRDASMPAPVAGDTAYLTTPDEFQIFNGTVWVTYAHVSAYQNIPIIDGSGTQTSIGVQGKVVTLYVNQTGDEFNDPLGTIPAAYRPPVEGNLTAGLFTNAGSGVAGLANIRVLTSGEVFLASVYDPTGAVGADGFLMGSSTWVIV